MSSILTQAAPMTYCQTLTFFFFLNELLFILVLEGLL